MASDVKVNAAGLMTMPAALSIASWIQPMISASLFDCRNSIGWEPAASRQ